MHNCPAKCFFKDVCDPIDNPCWHHQQLIEWQKLAVEAIVGLEAWYMGMTVGENKLPLFQCPCCKRIWTGKAVHAPGCALAALIRDAQGLSDPRDCHNCRHAIVDPDKGPVGCNQGDMSMIACEYRHYADWEAQP